jgi:hypothetical protein
MPPVGPGLPAVDGGLQTSSGGAAPSGMVRTQH